MRSSAVIVLALSAAAMPAIAAPFNSQNYPRESTSYADLIAREAMLEGIAARAVDQGSEALGWFSIAKDGLKVLDHVHSSDENKKKKKQKQQKKKGKHHRRYDPGEHYEYGKREIDDIFSRDIFEELAARTVPQGSEAFGWFSIAKDGIEALSHIHSHEENKKKKDQKKKDQKKKGKHRRTADDDFGLDEHDKRELYDIFARAA
ncbi:hypothetical protein IEO21_02936 [Rhodonia placenta]|uniref:Uncharacterized protein n=1 Tax=Rhodonia placenta TaxID=104341 RepID=A0A8H7P6R6_9APHY|nr:hypothetical protein IEO21_02936 [Postia placenta]